MRAATHPPGPDLALTGERTLPGIWHENYWYRRHEAVYAAFAPEVRGATVVEVGCGEGYGAALLAGRARRVLALDYDAPAVAHVGRRYPEVDVVRANAVALPVAGARADAVVAFQVVEHLWDQEAFVRECARVLRPGGRLLLSTPNRLTFSPDGPRNPCHAHELAPAELAALVNPHFAMTRLLGVHHGERLATWERDHGPIVDAQLSGPPESWPAALRREVADVTVADLAVRVDDLACCLDLVAVATRQPGDSDPTSQRSR